MSTPRQVRSPAFQFYADDFLAGTLVMDQADVGAYIRLLCHQWSRGSIPAEAEKQQRLAGGSVSADVLAKFPAGDDGLLRNPRLEIERQKQLEFRESQRQKGLRSAEMRKSVNHGSTTVGTAVQPNPQPNGQPKGNSPSPSPSPINTEGAPPPSPWLVAFDLEMPESLRTKECLDAVRLWMKYKSEKRQSYKQSGLMAALSKWAKTFTSATFPAAVEFSMANNWAGIFDIKDRKQINLFAPPINETPEEREKRILKEVWS
jgi:uncharacterized protein YdaU (DUF1376 family)